MKKSTLRIIKISAFIIVILLFIYFLFCKKKEGISNPTTPSGTPSGTLSGTPSGTQTSTKKPSKVNFSPSDQYDRIEVELPIGGKCPAGFYHENDNGMPNSRLCTNKCESGLSKDGINCPK